MKKFLLTYEDEKGSIQYEVCQEYELVEFDLVEYAGVFEINDRAYWAFKDLLSR